MEGLRGLAVILVFFVHYHALFRFWIDDNSRSFAVSYFLANIGHSGVDLFFVLSGYLIYGAVIRKKVSHLTFFRRRVERIYPTFLCVLAIYLMLSMFFPEENKIPARPLAAAIYILQNALLLPGIFHIQPIITVAWSLSYELFYYLSLPVLVMMLGMRSWRSSRRSIFFVALTLLCAVYCSVDSSMPYRLIIFIAGILLYELWHNSARSGKPITSRVDLAVLLTVVATFPLIYVVSEWPMLTGASLETAEANGIYREMILFVSFFALVFGCLGSQGALRSLFSWTPLRWLGNMSYSYYLIHGLTLKAIHLSSMHIVPADNKSTALFWIGLPLFFLLTLLTATVLFVLVEKRFSLQPVAHKPTQL